MSGTYEAVFTRCKSRAALQGAIDRALSAETWPAKERIEVAEVQFSDRGWAMLMQLVIAAALIGMAILGPHGPGGLATLGALALLVAVASASQDTAVDAWRIETARDPDELGLLTSSFTLGFRVALLITDAVILILAQHLSWPIAYVLMAVLMSVGLFAASRTPEPKHVAPTAAAAEAERITKRLATAENKQEALEDLFWALLNTNEFIFNR